MSAHIKSLGRVSIVFIAACAVFSFVSTVSAFAAERVWSGAGGDNKFSTAANWQGGVAPLDGDSVKFVKSSFPDIGDCSVARDEVEYDLDPQNITLAGIVFGDTDDTDYSDDCISPNNSDNKGVSVVTGNNVLKLSGDIQSFWGRGARIGGAVELTGDSEIQTSVHGVIAASSNNVSVTGDRSIDIYEMSGSGTITIGTEDQCPPYSYISDWSSFTGSVVLYCGNTNNSMLQNADTVTLRGASTIYVSTLLGEGVTLDSDIVVDTSSSNGLSAFQSTGYDQEAGKIIPQTSLVDVVFSGNITLNRDLRVTPTWTNVKFTKKVTGSGEISVRSGRMGRVTLSDNSVLHSPLLVRYVDEDNNSGICYENEYGLSISRNTKYIWNIDCPELTRTNEDSANSIQGILAGTGRIGNIFIANGGVIAPGNSPGTLSTGDVEFEEGAIYEFEVGGSGEGQYDQINVTGTVSLGNGTLVVLSLNEFTPSAGQSFTIINNDGNDPVEGTFANLPEGATVEVDGTPWFTISYVGGDGNDVVLTALPGVAQAGEESSRMFAVYAAAATVGFGVLLYIKKLRPQKSRARR